MSPEAEIRSAVHRLRTTPARAHDEPLADLLDAIADITTGLTRDPYEGTWQGRGLAVARRINGGTR